MYTGDDFNYPSLIAGDGAGFSHALLGIFDAIAAGGLGRLAALAQGDRGPLRRLDGSDRTAVAPHLPRPNAVLQDGHRLPLPGLMVIRIIS